MAFEGYARHEIRNGAARHYPMALAQVEGAPATLYALGETSLLDMPMVAISGARRATPYGEAVAAMAGRVVAECGVPVLVSGAASVDVQAILAAHEMGGQAVVWCATGPDNPHPNSHAHCYEEVLAHGGCIVSAEPWGTPAIRYAFLRRNGYIAAMAQSVIVTEAGQLSGTVMLAEAAADLGKSVYAAPGSIFSPASQGTNRLIAQGATPILGENDLRQSLRQELGMTMEGVYGDQAIMTDDPLLQALVTGPMRIDELTRVLDATALETLREIASLEVDGRVVRLPDGSWSLSRQEIARWTTEHGHDEEAR